MAISDLDVSSWYIYHWLHGSHSKLQCSVFHKVKSMWYPSISKTWSANYVMPMKRSLLGLSSELTIFGLKKLFRAIYNKSILTTGFSQLSNVNMVTRSANEHVQVMECCKLDSRCCVHADTPMHACTHILHRVSNLQLLSSVGHQT